MSAKVAELLFYPGGLAAENPLLLLSLLGLVVIALRKPRNSGAVLIPLLVFLVYFTYIMNKQLRFALLFLPFVCIIAAYGLVGMRKWLPHVGRKPVYVAIILIGLAIAATMIPRSMPLLY